MGGAKRQLKLYGAERNRTHFVRGARGLCSQAASARLRQPEHMHQSARLFSGRRLLNTLSADTKFALGTLSYSHFEISLLLRRISLVVSYSLMRHHILGSPRNLPNVNDLSLCKAMSG